MMHFLRLGLWVALTALALSACGAAGGEHQQAEAQAKGRPLPEYSQASLPAGQYRTTEFEPSLSFRLTGGNWVFEGPSGTLGDPEHPDYLFIGKDLMAGIAFFNLSKLKGVYNPRGPAGEIEPMPAPGELVGWFRHHPYLETSEPEPATVGGAKGVQFDVVTDLPKYYSGSGISIDDTCCVDIFALSSGGSSEVFYSKREAKKARYIILKDVKGVPVVIYYDQVAEDFDEFEPMAKKMLQSVEWTGT
jgi:hypothetical protein